MNTTALDFFNNMSDKLKSDREDMPLWMIEAAKEFAQLHVKAALDEAALKCNVRITESIDLANITPHYQIEHGKYVICDKYSIINSYPLENIK